MGKLDFIRIKDLLVEHSIKKEGSQSEQWERILANLFFRQINNVFYKRRKQLYQLNIIRT